MKPLQIKVNVSGSWANLRPVRQSAWVKSRPPARRSLPLHLGAISFKVVDNDQGITTEQFSQPPRAGEPHGWYIPRR